MEKKEFNEQALQYIQQIIESGKSPVNPSDSVGVLGANMEKLIQLCKDHPLESLDGEDDTLSRRIHEAVIPCISVEDSGNPALIVARKNRMVEDLRAMGNQYVKKEDAAAVDVDSKKEEKSSYDFKEIDTKFSDGLQIGKKGEKARLKAMRIAYDLGFSKEDCRRIGVEIGKAYAYNRITGRKQDVKDLLYHSRTFRGSENGVAYLKENGFHVDPKSLIYQDALQNKRELLDIGAVKTNWVTKPKGSALSAMTTNFWGWIVEPMDRAKGYSASRVAQRLGYSPEEVKQIGREVTEISDRDNLFSTFLGGIFGGSSPTTDQLLFQSKTFQSHPELAKPYIGLKHIESKESQFEGYVLDGEKLRENVEDGNKVLPTVKGYMGFDDPMKEQAAYEKQSSATNRIGSFLSSGVGFVLLSLLLFFLFKALKFHPVGSALYALGGSAGVNLLGRLMTGGGAQECQSAGNIEDMMREVGIAKSPAEEQAEDYQLQNTRDIPIGEEKGIELSESDYLRFVQENGFRGLRQQLINDPWKYHEFLSNYGLIEAEKQEANIFRRNGDWLSYTRKALGEKLSSMNLNERTESQQLKVKSSL